jgi:hypothetical protein
MTHSIRGTLVLVGAALAALGSFCATARAVSISVTGPEEIVYDYTTMRCDDGDAPDGPTQAFRDSLGRLQLIAADGAGRRMIGPDFDHLAHDCVQRFAPIYDPNPAHYNFGRLMYSVWTANGQDVYALIHSEWHGWDIPGACPASFGRRRCGSGGITFAVSHDAGDTYVAPGSPDNLVATVPPRPTIDDGRTGLFSPTDLIKKGSYWYSMMMIGAIGDQDVGACPMRTQNPADPKSWRGWDGSSFTLRFRNNFYERVTPQRTHMCEPVSFDRILSMSRSLTFNTFLNKYVLTGSSIKFDPAQSRNVTGIYYSTSDDLVHWSMRQLIMEVPSLMTHLCGGPDPLAYPSLIDQDSTDRTFRITDATMYLYFTRLHYNEACQLTLDRDLVRVPIQFSP